MVDSYKKYLCMFGGGAIRGAAHAGVIRAFEELGIETTTLVGSSVGAMVAMLCAVGYNSQEITEIFMSVDFELFRDISFGFDKKFALSKGEIFLNWLRELIEKKYYGDKYKKGEMPHILFKDLNKNLIIITTNMNNFTCKEFSTYSTPDFEVAMAVRISCCMPGLMRAITLEDEVLVDGDLQKGKPMWSLTEHTRNSKDNILEIRLEGEFAGIESPIKYINGIYSCMTYSETNFIKSIYDNYDKYNYLVINTGDVVVADFNYPIEKRKEIVERGYNQTIEYFTKRLVEKRTNLLEVYKEINNKMLKTLTFTTSKKYTPAKNCLCELFTYLIDVKDIIDVDIYKSIKHIYKIMKTNIKQGLLGHARCTNRELLLAELKRIVLELDKKESGCTEYIKSFQR